MIKRPMLAAKATEQELQNLFKRFPAFLLSPKIDGIRAMVVNGQLVSRTMKPIRNYYTQGLFGRSELEGLDGELVVGNPWDKNLMQQTSSGVMSYDGRPDVGFHLFDNWNISAPFHDRFKSALSKGMYHQRTYGILHTLISSYEQMLEYEEHYLQQGYEGVMLRRLDGPYKQNRSTLKEAYLVKVKRFADGEARILDFEVLMRNLNTAELDERGYTKRSHAASGKVEADTLGTILVEDLESGICFCIGSGFTEQQRKDLWKDPNLVGKIVKYKSFKNAGVKIAPRHPIFLGFRDKEDM